MDGPISVLTHLGHSDLDPRPPAAAPDEGRRQCQPVGHDLEQQGALEMGADAQQAHGYHARLEAVAQGAQMKLQLLLDADPGGAGTGAAGQLTSHERPEEAGSRGQAACLDQTGCCVLWSEGDVSVSAVGGVCWVKGES